MFRNLLVVPGGLLDRQSTALASLDPARDCIWMSEAGTEPTHVRTDKTRIALVLTAMRHLRDDLRARGLRVEYTPVDDSGAERSLAAELLRGLRTLRPAQVLVIEPRGWRLLRSLIDAWPTLRVVPDPHFVCSTVEFLKWAASQKQLRFESFYRYMRRRHGVLMDGPNPAGGHWVFDEASGFGVETHVADASGPALEFSPDGTTREVLQVVEERFARYPGSLERFGWPATPADAEIALAGFLENELPALGAYDEAMWVGPAPPYREWILSCLNLALLNPRHAIGAAERAWRSAKAPLPAVERFIRYVLGWREYFRGLYWLQLPGYEEASIWSAGA